MAFSTFRTSKVKTAGALKGLCTEHDRTSEMKEKAIEEKHFSASDIDWNRTKDNVVLERAYEYKDWENGAWECEKELLEKHSVKHRKDAVLAHDSVYVASPEWFQDKTKEEVIEKFKEDLEWHKRNFGIVIDATIHFDEKTPHMHVISVPLYQDQKGNIKLSAKHFTNGPKQLAKLQDRFYKEVAMKQGFDECAHHVPEERRKHMTNQEYAIKKNNRILSDQEQEIAQNISTLDVQNEIIEHNRLSMEDYEKKLKMAVEQLEKTLELQVKAAEIKKPLFGDKEVKIYHKDSLAKAWDVAKEAREYMEKAQYYAWSVNGKERALDERETAIRAKEDAIEPLHEEAIKNRNKARELVTKQEAFIKQQAEVFLASRLADVDMDKLEFCEDFIRQHGGSSLAEAMEKAWQEYEEELYETVRGIHL